MVVFILGGLSDRFGCRLVLLVVLVGFSFDYFVMVVVLSFVFFFVVRFIFGVLGVIYLVVNVCVVDILILENCVKNFGFLGGVIGLGFVFGFVFGGLFGEYGYRIFFIVVGLFLVIVCVYGYFVFFEMFFDNCKRRFELCWVNLFGSLVFIGWFLVVFWIFLGVFFV